MAQRNREIAFVGYNCFVSSAKTISSACANPLVGVHGDFQSAKAPTAHVDNDGDDDGERHSRREERSASSPPRRQQHVVHLDFFGEPVTFGTAPSSSNASSASSTTSSNTAAATSNAMAAYDGHLLTVVTRGLSAIGGGEEEGLEVQSAHAAALSWSEALRFASVWNPASDEVDDNNGSDEEEHAADRAAQQSCPMLAVVAVSPLLAQAGFAYASHLDNLLQHTRPAAPGLPTLSFVRIARSAVQCFHHEQDQRRVGLSDREVLHLQALECLLDQNPTRALSLLLKLLRVCPGDVLALSLAVDLSHRLGNAAAALRAAGGVAAYWEERKGGMLTPSLPGHAISTSYQAVGLAATSGGGANGGSVSLAELLADRVLQSRRHCGITGGVATWAHLLVCDATGRVAEGISAAANSDGIRNYEGCGFLFFNATLAGYGARFALDREERGRGKSKALRLYDEQFRQVLEVSGFSSGRPWQRPNQPAPISWAQSTVRLESGGSASEPKRGSFFSRLFGRDSKKSQAEPAQTENPDESQQYEIITQGNYSPSSRLERWDPLAEDVLTWLPPTPNLLADATLLLLRFTLNGTISRSDLRWEEVRKAWDATLSMEDKYGGRLSELSPLASVAASIVVPPSETGADQMGSGRLGLGLHMLGEELQLGSKPTGDQEEVEDQEQTPTLLGRIFIADSEPEFWLPTSRNDGDDNGASGRWKTIVEHLATAIDVEDEGDSLRAWTFDSRPILEHAIVYACCKSGDLESLCLARSICGQGVTLRPNSPEEWWRYSIVLGLLGDDVASEDALLNSMRVGGGQGARKA